MNLATIVWFSIAACIVYLVAQDDSVLTGLVLLSKSANIWLTRQWFRIRYHPDSPWVRYAIKRNADKLAKEFLNDYRSRGDGE